MVRFVTRQYDSPEMMGYPSYCVWDTELDELAGDKGQIMIFSSLTGEIACAKANEKTLELNARAMRLPVYDMTPAFPSTLKRLLTLWDNHEEKYWGDGTAVKKWNDITERIEKWLKEESEIEFLGDFKEEFKTYSWAIKDNIGRLGRLEVTDKVLGEGWDVFFKFGRQPEMEFEGKEYPNIPEGFPDPNGHWSYSRDTVLVDFNPYTFLEAIDGWFREHEEEA